MDIASDSATVKKVKKVTPESNAAKAKKTTTPVKKVTKNQDKTPTRKLNTNNVLTRKNLRGKGSPKAATDSGNQSIKKFMTAKREDVNKQMGMFFILLHNFIYFLYFYFNTYYSLSYILSYFNLIMIK